MGWNDHIEPENYQYTDNYGDGGFASQKDYEESTRSEKDLETDSFLKGFYRGQGDYCLRHQMSKCTECKEVKQ